jgi:hypothetical protein
MPVTQTGTELMVIEPALYRPSFAAEIMAYNF